MNRYGTPLESFAKVRAKASRHAARNPLALLRKGLHFVPVQRTETVHKLVDDHFTTNLDVEDECWSARAPANLPSDRAKHDH